MPRVITLTTRPINGSCNFNAVGNPIVYVFTTTGLTTEVNYRVEVEVFKASDNTSLNGVAFSFTPNPSGVTTANISACVKPYLSPDWTLPAAVNEIETGTSLGVYIKYTEKFDGSAVAAVDDVANPIYPMFATNQIGTANGANMLDYFPASSTKKWLTRFQLNSANKGLVLWRDWPFTLSMIWPNAMTGVKKLIEEYDASDSLINGTETALTDHANAVNRLDVLRGITLDGDTTKIKLSIYNGLTGELVQDPTMTTGVGWANVSIGAAWTISSGGESFVDITSAASISKSLDGTLSSSPIATKRAYVKGSITRTAGSPVGIIQFVFIKAGITIESITVNFSVDSVTSIQTFEINRFLTDAVGYDTVRAIALLTPFVSGDQARIHVDDFSLKSITPLNEQLEISVRDACDYDSNNNVIWGNNPVMLVWKSSTGSDAQFLFDKYHEYSYNYSNGKKAKRIVLFAKELSLVQWEAINELNTLGEIYSQNITTLSSSVYQTSKRVGTQVYMIDAAGNKTGVIVLPASDKVQVRNSVNAMSIEIELPEILSIQ